MDDAGVTAGLVVRRARAGELAACAELYARVLRETFTWMDPAAHRASDFLDHARDEEVAVAVLDGEIVGLAAYYRPSAFLHSLYVTRRGEGIGKALLDHVCARAGGPVTLKVQRPNLRARAFYRREGFEVAGEGADELGRPPWLLMRKGSERKSNVRGSEDPGGTSPFAGEGGLRM